MDLARYLTDISRPKTNEWKTNGPKISFKDCLRGTGAMEFVPRNELFETEKREKDDSLMNFGKYAQKKVLWVRNHDRRYFEWALENVKGFEERVNKLDE